MSWMKPSQKKTPNVAGDTTRPTISPVNSGYSTRRITIEIENNASKKFVIGIAVTHIYGIEVMADTHNLALLKMDNWVRGNLPADELAPKMRSSDLKVIGLGVVTDGMVAEVGDISSDTRAEMAARGKLPETGWLHLFPAPPSSITQSGKMAEASIEAP